MNNYWMRHRLSSEIETAIQELVEEGLVADSGRRRWSERTGRYEIMWVSTEVGDKLAQSDRRYAGSAQSPTESSQR